MPRNVVITAEYENNSPHVKSLNNDFSSPKIFRRFIFVHKLAKSALPTDIGRWKHSRNSFFFKPTCYTCGYMCLTMCLTFMVDWVDRIKRAWAFIADRQLGLTAGRWTEKIVTLFNWPSLLIPCLLKAKLCNSCLLVTTRNNGGRRGQTTKVRQIHKYKIWFDV